MLLFNNLLMLLPILSFAAEHHDGTILVGNRRFADPIETSNCSFVGSVVLGGPSSIEPDDKFFNLAKKMYSSMTLTVDLINKYQCGVHLSSGNYAIEMITYGDETSQDTTRTIGNKLVLNPEVDVVLGGYSSGLTGPLSEITNSNNRLLMAPGAASTSVFQDRDYSFGNNPPSAKYPSQGMAAVAEVGAKTVATVYEDVGFTKGACGGIPDLADIYDMTVTSMNEVPSNPNITALSPVAEKLSEEDPDVVVTCVYDTGCVNWMKAMRKSGWSPKAQMFTICVGLHGVTQELGTDAEYVMGVTIWDPSLNIKDDVTGLTPNEFAESYQEYTADIDVTYHAASGASAISILKQAMERADTFTDTQALRDVIASDTFTTVYGQISFDVNGQSQAPTLLVQYDLNQTVQTVFPHDSSSATILYPMPSWKHRDCVHLSDCFESGGACNEAGGCVCLDVDLYTSTGIGETALCSLIEKDESKIIYITESTNLGLAIGLPVVCVLAIGAMVFLFYEHKRKQNDSVWMVKKEELIFSDPPEVLGRGTFGLVLLAEYRGTQVAVKRVIPDKQTQRRGGAARRLSISDRSTAESSSHEGCEPGKHQRSSSAGYNSTTGSNSRGSDVVGNQSGGLGMSSWAAMSLPGVAKSGPILQSTGKTKPSNKGSDKELSIDRKKLKQDFLEEMRYLSKLRHPCVTTVMGKFICSR